MNKGLEALERLMADYYEMCQDLGNNDDQYQRCNLTSERAIIEKELEDLDTIKKIFSQYGLEYKLTLVREALLLLKQYQGSYGVRGQALITKKLKALEIIKRVYRPTEGQLKVVLKIERITQEEYDLLKEVLL